MNTPANSSALARASVGRALTKLDRELLRQDEVLDLLDTFEVLASALAGYKLPKKETKRRKSLDEVLKYIGKEHRQPTLEKLGEDLEGVIRELRRAAYNDDSTELLEKANETREQVAEAVREWMNE